MFEIWGIVYVFVLIIGILSLDFADFVPRFVSPDLESLANPEALERFRGLGELG